MNEIIILKIGYIIGVLTTFFAIFVVYMISYGISLNKHNKFLIETKQMQKYEEWLIINKKIKSSQFKKLFE